MTDSHLRAYMPQQHKHVQCEAQTPVAFVNQDLGEWQEDFLRWKPEAQRHTIPGSL